MEIKRTFDLLEHIRQQYPDMKDVIAGKENGKWIRYSATEYGNLAEDFSCGLFEYGLDKGDLVVTISNNRPEWNIVDMGLSQSGIIHVPVYPTISTEEYSYILGHCEPKLVFVSDRLLYEKIRPVADKIKSIINLLSY